MNTIEKIIIIICIISIFLGLSYEFSGQRHKDCIQMYGEDYKIVEYKGVFDHCGGICYPSYMNETEFIRQSVCSLMM